VAVYAPLAAAPVPPDVVLVRGNARQLMLLAEASQAAGVAGTGATMGRPTCAVLPEAINSARTAAVVEEKLAVIVRANQEMEKFHRGRASATPTA
jgi:uncharacterized protein (DUF169 family)